MHTVCMSFIFYKHAHFLQMMNVAVVQNKDTSRTWVRIRKGDLYTALDIVKHINKYSHIPLVCKGIVGTALK